jgi:hypothetical protein
MLNIKKTNNLKGVNMKHMKHETVANVGDTIRANDFMPREGMNDCYIQGKVIEKGNCDDKYYACYKISLTKRVMNGKDITPKIEDKIWYVPFEIDFDEHDQRVVKVKERA